MVEIRLKMASNTDNNVELIDFHIDKMKTIKQTKKLIDRALSELLKEASKTWDIEGETIESKADNEV